MYTMVILGKRRFHRRILLPVILFALFLFGFLLGFFTLSSQGEANFSPRLLLQNQLFYSGEFADLKEVQRSLPILGEGEGVSITWDVSSYQDEVTKATIPVFVSTATSSVSDLIRVPQEPLALTAVMGDTPRVLIYSTHTSEDYAGGGTVVDVAHALASDLENNFGIKAVVSDTVHDSPEWYKSYANSRQTASKMLTEYPEADLLIDLHRDSGLKKEATTIAVDGQNAGKVLLVVGSNMTMKHPNWEENLATANALGDCIKTVNSKLLSGVRVQKGRYNQHLTPKAVLLEFGTDLNTLDEVKVSASLVAEAINNYLQG